MCHVFAARSKVIPFLLTGKGISFFDDTFARTVLVTCLLLDFFLLNSFCLQTIITIFPLMTGNDLVLDLRCSYDIRVLLLSAINFLRECKNTHISMIKMNACMYV